MDKLLLRSACIADLKKRAKKRIPTFVFDYIEEGCNANMAVENNRSALNNVYLRPDYLAPYKAPDLSTQLLGQSYAAPIGVAPLGLTGLVWPQASAMHARAAHAANIPFVLSTVSTLSIEDAALHAKENFWFQLYPPSDAAIGADLLKRAAQSGCKNLVVTLDVPTASRRIKAIKSGLSVPPKITPTSLFQSAIRPMWSMATLVNGLPQFANLTPYMDSSTMAMGDAAEFMRTRMRAVVDAQALAQIRHMWPHNLIVKGVSHVADAQHALELGVDGIIVSNHGGRQLDAAQPSAMCLRAIVDELGHKAVIMADSGVESGIDVARYLALGAQMVFTGRAMLYGVAAHGEDGATHTIDLILAELEQIMSQLHCAKPASLGAHLIRPQI